MQCVLGVELIVVLERLGRKVSVFFVSAKQKKIKMQYPLDGKLEKANQIALTSGTLTPLIKEELWSFVQSRRLSEGKDELQVVFEPPDKVNLSPEEEEKAKRRKERNRAAAKKCRAKRKKQADNMDEVLKEEEEKNKNLKIQIRDLEAQKSNFLTKLREYSVPSPAPSTSSFCAPPSPFSICSSPPPYPNVESPLHDTMDNYMCSLLNVEEPDPEISQFLDGEQQVVPSSIYQGTSPEPFPTWTFLS